MATLGPLRASLRPSQRTGHRGAIGHLGELPPVIVVQVPDEVDLS